jgi:hypothetical protein
MQADRSLLLTSAPSRHRIRLNVPSAFAQHWPSLWEVCAVDDVISDFFRVPVTERVPINVSEKQASEDPAYLQQRLCCIKRLYRHVWVPPQDLKSKRMHMIMSDLSDGLRSISIVVDRPFEARRKMHYKVERKKLAMCLHKEITSWSRGTTECRVGMSDKFMNLERRIDAAALRSWIEDAAAWPDPMEELAADATFLQDCANVSPRVSQAGLQQPQSHALTDDLVDDDSGEAVAPSGPVMVHGSTASPHIQSHPLSDIEDCTCIVGGASMPSPLSTTSA